MQRIPTMLRFDSYAASSMPRRNLILNSLSDETLTRLTNSLRLVELPAGTVLYEFGQQPSHVYFPVTAIISSIHTMRNGDATEVSSTGKEGMIGVALFLDSGPLHHSAMVRVAGSAWRGAISQLRDEFRRASDFQHSVLRYVHEELVQCQLIGACNSHHSVEDQFCRWLLLSYDRTQSEEILMTQEAVADMLGVRRQGVTAAAGRLQRLGLVAIKRGSIRILDRAGLEKACCECYGAIRNVSSRRER